MPPFFSVAHGIFKNFQLHNQYLAQRKRILPNQQKPQSTSGIEDLFKDSPAVSVSSAPAVSQANAKNDIMSLFEKVSTALLLQHCSRRMALPTKERAHPWCI
jgi:hypothetical protein